MMLTSEASCDLPVQPLAPGSRGLEGSQRERRRESLLGLTLGEDQSLGPRPPGPEPCTVLSSCRVTTSMLARLKQAGSGADPATQGPGLSLLGAELRLLGLNSRAFLCSAVIGTDKVGSRPCPGLPLPCPGQDPVSISDPKASEDTRLAGKWL